MKNNLKQVLIMFFKCLVYIGITAIFFGLFATRNIGLKNISRTFAITLMTYAVVGILMLRVYGNFEIGHKKSKPVIYATIIAAFMTDIITYIQLMIMNTNPNNNPFFRLDDLDLLLWVMILQSLLIVVLTYAGNHIYFRFYKPLKTLIIHGGNEQAVYQVVRFMKRYQKQYAFGIDDVIALNGEDIASIIDRYEYVVMLDVPAEKRQSVMDYCYRQGISISFNPTISDVIETGASQVVFDDKPMLHIDATGLTLEQRILKRIVDLMIAIAGLFLSSPLWLLIAIAIKADDKGPILFKQKRLTVDGKAFHVYKFRTMKENAGNYSATEDDDRITKTGRVLRKIRADELPQLLNILIGDMSMVGPRPEMIENIQDYEQQIPEFRYRLKVKAGLTGYAQIEGKYNTSPLDKLLLDLTYIENYSLLLDFKLILRTLIVLFKKDSTEGFRDDNSAVPIRENK